MCRGGAERVEDQPGVDPRRVGLWARGAAGPAAIYAAAFNQNPEFFSFYRSMEAYRSTFRGRNDVMLLEANSDFLRYFRDSLGKGSAPRK